jgi:hypothetical protein
MFFGLAPAAADADAARGDVLIGFLRRAPVDVIGHRDLQKTDLLTRSLSQIGDQPVN